MAKNDRGWLERQARDRTECNGCVYKDADCLECNKMALLWAWYYFCLEMPILKKLARVPQPCYLKEEKSDEQDH